MKKTLFSAAMITLFLGSAFVATAQTPEKSETPTEQPADTTQAPAPAKPQQDKPAPTPEKQFSLFIAQQPDQPAEPADTTKVPTKPQKDEPTQNEPAEQPAQNTPTQNNIRF